MSDFTQIAFVTRNLDETLNRWIERTGAGPFFKLNSDIAPDRTYRGSPAKDEFTAAMGFLGSTMLEFIQPENDAPSVFQEILQTRGEGIHHVFPKLRVYTPEQYDEQYAAYVAAGYEPALSFVVPGTGRHDLFDATRDFGHFFELLEIQPSTMAMMEKMHELHVGWDGKDPVRAFGDVG